MKTKAFLAFSLTSFIIAFGIAFSAAKRSTPPSVPVGIEPAEPPATALTPFVAQDLSPTAWLKRLRTADTRTFPQLYAFCEDNDSDELLSMLVRYWTRTDPEGFLTFLNQEPPFFKKESHAHYLFSEWGARDFEKALEAAHTLPPHNPMRPHVLRAVVKARFVKNPEEAIAALSEIYANAGGAGLGLWNEANAEKHLSSLTKLPRGNLVNSEIDSVVSSWLKRDPTAAMEWMLQDIDVLDSHHRFSSAMFDLSRQDPQAALDYFRKTPSAKRRGELARNISQYIARADPDTAVTWLENEVGGWFQIAAAADAANELAEEEPTLGAAFAIRFTNPILRKRAIHEALKVFHQEDPQGMQTWANTVTDQAAREAVQAEIADLNPGS